MGEGQNQPDSPFIEYNWNTYSDSDVDDDSSDATSSAPTFSLVPASKALYIHFNRLVEEPPPEGTSFGVHLRISKIYLVSSPDSKFRRKFVKR